MNIENVPEWLGGAVLGAVIALLGYVGTQVMQVLAAVLASERRRRARLAELLALVRAGDAAWKIQSENRDRLYAAITLRLPAVSDASTGFDHLFAAAYPNMTSEERELFDVVRAITIHTVQPLNASLLAWLRADADFRVRRPDTSLRGRLARYLQDLETHLLLWEAKYRIWIPEHPERALVYLADEERHGIGFPRDGATLVDTVLRNARWLG